MTYPKINGNVIIFELSGLTALADKVRHWRLEQFSVVVLEDHILLSTPITLDLTNTIPGIIREARSRASKGNPDPSGGGPDGTPPNGGTPGTPTIDKYTYTEAIAA